MKPTNWEPARDGQGATRKSSKGNTIHIQQTPAGPIKHLNRPDGSSQRLGSETPDPRSRK